MSGRGAFFDALAGSGERLVVTRARLEAAVEDAHEMVHDMAQRGVVRNPARADGRNTPAHPRGQRESLVAFSCPGFD